MAIQTVKITELTSSTGIEDTDLFITAKQVSSSYVTRKATASQVIQYITSSVIPAIQVISISGSSFTGSTANFVILSASQITGAFDGVYFNLTGSSSSFPNFTLDVRSQFTAGTGIDINSGIISVTNIPTSSLVSNTITIGDTTIGLGLTASNISGLNSLSSSQITSSDGLFDKINAANIDISNILIVTGSISSSLITGSIVTGNIAQFTTISGSTVSASVYLGLDLQKVITTTSITITPEQRVVFAKNDVSSSLVITLPSISSAQSKEYYISKADAVTGTVTISASSPNLINGQTSYQLNGPFQSVTVIHDGSNWFVF